MQWNWRVEEIAFFPSRQLSKACMRPKNKVTHSVNPLRQSESNSQGHVTYTSQSESLVFLPASEDAANLRSTLQVFCLNYILAVACTVPRRGRIGNIRTARH